MNSSSSNNNKKRQIHTSAMQRQHFKLHNLQNIFLHPFIQSVGWLIPFHSFIHSLVHSFIHPFDLIHSFDAQMHLYIDFIYNISNRCFVFIFCQSWNNHLSDDVHVEHVHRSVHIDLINQFCQQHVSRWLLLHLLFCLRDRSKQKIQLAFCMNRNVKKQKKEKKKHLPTKRKREKRKRTLHQQEAATSKRRTDYGSTMQYVDVLNLFSISIGSCLNIRDQNQWKEIYLFIL